jgi:hypothetical protein
MSLVLFECGKLHARITREQCERNRMASDHSPRGGREQPIQCPSCTDWQAFGTDANPGDHVIPALAPARPAASPQAGARLTAPLPKRAQEPPKPAPAPEPPAALAILADEVQALAKAGHVRIGLERLRSLVSPRLPEPLAYWPWRDLVTEAGLKIVPGKVAEVVLQ